MPFGSFRLNTLSAAIASGGSSSDAPLIPSLTFEQSSCSIGSTFGTYEISTPKNIAYQYNANFAFATKNTTTGVYNSGISTAWGGASATFYPNTVATGTTGQNMVATSAPGMPSTSTTQFINFIGAPSGVRYRTGVFGGAAAPTGGTISTAQSRTSSYTTPTVSASHSPLTSALTTHRPLLAYHTLVSGVNYIAIAVGSQISGSTGITFSISLSAGSQVASGSTANFGNWVDSCGFSSATSSIYKYCVGYTGSSTTYQLSIFKTYLTNVYPTLFVAYSGNTVISGSVDTIWDDQPNNKFVAVSCVVTSTDTILRSAKVTTWGASETTAVAPTVIQGTAVSIGSSLSKAQIHRTTLNGLGILTYVDSLGTGINCRLISVDSSTGDITVGDEINLGAGDLGTINTYGVGVGRDSTNKLCIGVANHSQTALLYRSTTAIA